ncbi:hypothetical protein NA57DRAFT_50874 [Rhizodiscina lignyota]|uniref:Uncharacterized protein n=1 Tax=Rhizodiscina lignyota TaxID=1504668 RepID=A0A9P4IMU3_9PEZI|nr:hypothetical protein NA57DRAFT_50874 [Rhizodiscina lignyota]
MPSANSSPSKVTLPASTLTTNATLPSDLQAALLNALLAPSSGAMPRIQSTLYHELAASGWVDNMRAHIQYLLRSGECGSYTEVMGRVMRDFNMGEKAHKLSNGVNGVNGANGISNGKGVGERGVEEGGIKVPDAVVKEGIRLVKREVDRVAEVVIDDE